MKEHAIPLKAVLFISFLFRISSVSAQISSSHENATGTIQGFVFNEQKQAVSGLSARLHRQADSTLVKETVTAKDGGFAFSAPFGKYYIELSSLSYEKNLENIVLSATNIKVALGQLILSKKVIQLKDIVVEGEGPMIVMKNDTIEYNASALKPEETDVLKDLISKVPGIQIDDNGNVSVNGKPIKKILVDGREFFGGNIKLALEKLPATMIKKLQVYEKQSDASKITGYKDKNPDQVLNLVIKDEAKHAVFGDLQSASGTGKLYREALNLFSMQNKNQYSLTGNMDNTAEMINSGTTRMKNAAINISPSFHKLSIESDANYNGYNNEAKNLTDIFYSALNRNSQQTENTMSRISSFSGGATFNWNPDSLTTVRFRTMYNSDNSRIDHSSSRIAFETGKDTTREETNNWNENLHYSTGNSLEVARLVGEKGRSITLRANNSINRSDGNGAYVSEVAYPGSLPSKNTDQKSKSKDKNINYSGEIHYIAPLGKDKLLNIGYGFSQSNNKQINDIRKKDAEGNYTVLDSAYARNTRGEDYTHDLSLGFQLSKGKNTLNIDFSAKPSVTKSEITMGDSLIDRQKQSVVDYAPTVTFQHPQTEKSPGITFAYRGATSHADFHALSPDTVIESALSKSYGNPDLKMSFNHGFNLNFSKLFSGQSMLNLTLKGNFITNKMVGYNMTDDLGNSVSTYRNVNGNHSESLDINYSWKIRIKKQSLKMNVSQSLRNGKNITFVNGEKSSNNTWGSSTNLHCLFRNGQSYFMNYATFTNDHSRNNLSNTQNKNLMHFADNISSKIPLPYHIFIASNLSYIHYWGYPAGSKTDNCDLDCTVSRSFLQKRLTLSLGASNILDTRNLLNVSFQDDIRTSSQLNRMGRYFMFTVRYAIKAPPGKGGAAVIRY